MNLEHYRKKVKLTQQEVADIIGCQREVYRRYEKGVREVPIHILILLADYYHISLDELVGHQPI